MTIDEAIVYLNNHGSLDNRNSQDKVAVQTIINCVMWYKEQDLIKREDAMSIASNIEKELPRKVRRKNKYEIDLLFTACERLKGIPKAEPKYSGCGYDMFCEKTDCKGCVAEPKEINQSNIYRLILGSNYVVENV